MKIKKSKLLLIVLCLISLCFFTSCKQSINNLKKALDNADNLDNVTSTITTTVTISGEVQTTTMSVEQDGNKVMLKMTMDDQDVSMFYDIKDDIVNIYMLSDDGEWAEYSSIDKNMFEEYGTLDTDLPEFEIGENTFTYQDGIWVGNTDELSSKMEDYIDNLLQSSGIPSGISFKLNKYNIKVKRKQVVNFEMEIECSYMGEEIKIELVGDFTKIGKTKVTSPIK